jgi:hypothetical protein
MSEDDIEILDLKNNPDDNQVEGIEEGKLFQSIWLRPRDTLKYILNKCPDKYVTQLLVIGGAISALGNAIEGSPLFELGPWISLALIVIIGAILGPIVNMIFAVILNMVGRWIGGKGNYQKILAVVAWSMVPSIVGVIFIFFQIGFFGPYYILFEGDISAIVMDFTKSELILYVFAFLNSVVSIWALVILVTGLSVAHKFRIGKAILNLLIPILAIAIPLGIVAFILGDLMRGI